MILTIFLFTLALSFVSSQDILVQLPNGMIRGKESFTLTNQQYFSFLKVPYAAPPVGNLRFKDPVPPQNWDGILDTLEFNVMCYQSSWNPSEETEDCLYLNVFTPELNPAVGYPVMLYIFGGGFCDGNCLLGACGPEYLLDRNVIVITINYRVGPFGFLSTGDEVIPGNMGLKDQQLAIKWTYDNIALFGGDPQKITIFGQSAGSASVAYQLLNPNNEGLIKGAIAISGSFLSPWSFQRNARYYAFQTGAQLDESFNTSNDSQALLDFLMNASAADIDAASDRVRKARGLDNREVIQGYTYAPVVEPNVPGAFLTEKMYVRLKAGNALRVPLLIGTTSEEKLDQANDYNWLKDQFLRALDDNPSWIVPNDMRIMDFNNKSDMGLRIKNIYTTGLFQDHVGDGVRFISDEAFTHCIIKHAEIQSQFSEVYYYQMSYDGPMGNFFTVVDGCEKVAHTEDLKYVFRQYDGGYDNSDLGRFPAADVLTHDRILKIWTDFAKTQNPTPEPSDLLQNIIWPTVSPGGIDSFLYVDIGENLVIMDRPKGQTYPQWVQLYESLGYDDFDTY